jgi:tetratricopeptide (TPR) repeat protein
MPGLNEESAALMNIVRWFSPGLIALFLLGCGDRQKITTSSPDALQWYQKGISLYENFYYREALEAIDKAIAADSAFALAWVRRAVISFSTHNQDAARKEIATALALSGGASRAEQMLVRMWSHRINFEQRRAADVADSLIDRYPYMREAYLVRGQLFEWEKNNEAAIRMYERAVAMDSTYAQAVMSIGYAYSSLGDVNGAIAYMERYIRLLPHEADPRASYGDVLLRAGRYDEALAQYKASLVAKPDYWYSMQKIGDVCSYLGRLKQAEAYYDTSLTLMPASRQIEVMRFSIAGRMDFLRADYDKATGEFMSALGIDSTSGDAAFSLVYALVRQGNIEAAGEVNERIRAEVMRRNLFESPARAGYELMRSLILREQGKFDDALAACDLALQYSIPLTRASIFNERAEIHLRAKEYEPALDACEDALALNPNSPDLLLTLVKIYHAKKDVKMTVEIGGRLLALWAEADPDFSPLRELQQIIGRTPLAGR